MGRPSTVMVRASPAPRGLAAIALSCEVPGRRSSPCDKRRSLRQRTCWPAGVTLTPRIPIVAAGCTHPVGDSERRVRGDVVAPCRDEHMEMAVVLAEAHDVRPWRASEIVGTARPGRLPHNLGSTRTIAAHRRRARSDPRKSICTTTCSADPGPRWPPSHRCSCSTSRQLASTTWSPVSWEPSLVASPPSGEFDPHRRERRSRQPRQRGASNAAPR